MEIHRFARIAGLTGVLSACGFSAGGLQPAELEPARGDASHTPPARPAASDAASDPGIRRLLDAAVMETGSAPAPDPCPLSGTYALRLDLDVHWNGTTLFGIVPIVLPGDGRIAVQTSIDIADEAGHPVTVRACGAAIPDFGSVVGEVYGADFPDRVWEKLRPRWSTHADFACAGVGCAFRAEPVVAQLGIELPPGASWPSPRGTIAAALQRDDDQDGLPGVRIEMRGPAQGATYKHPPTSFLLQQRVTEIQLALRFGVTLEGMIASCDIRSGTIDGATMEIRALSCRLEGGQPCSEQDLSFIDDNLPVWTVRSASFTAARIPAGSACAAARERLP